MNITYHDMFFEISNLDINKSILKVRSLSLTHTHWLFCRMKSWIGFQEHTKQTLRAQQKFIWPAKTFILKSQILA